MPIAYLKDQPTVEIDADGVEITYCSGNDTRILRCSRAYFRRYLETNIRALNEYEREERCRVLQFRSG